MSDSRPSNTYPFQRVEDVFKPHGKPWESLGQIRIDRIVETKEYLDAKTGRVVRTEKRINGVLVEDDKT